MEFLYNLLLEDDIKQYESQLMEMMLTTKQGLTEGVLDFSNNDPGEMFDEAIKRLEAAKRGLGLANKLRTPEEKKANKSRILGNLNRIRALIANLTKQIDSAGQVANQQIAQHRSVNSAGLNPRPAVSAAPHQAIPGV